MNCFSKIILKNIFIIGFLVFLFSKLVMVCVPMILRESPSIPDDSYAYIAKANQLKLHFKDMPGLTDIKRQLKPVDSDNKLTFLNHKNYLRIVNHYHPLHSLLIVGLDRLGLTLEQSYNAICIAGALLVCFACGYWLYVMWGAEAA